MVGNAPQRTAELPREGLGMQALMTLDEVATYLRLSKDTVYRMVQSGRIPAAKVGTQWRFRKPEVEQWLESNRNRKRGRK